MAKKIISFQVDAEDERRIEAEMRRLIDTNPGVRISKCAAIRSLLARGSVEDG